MRVDIKYTGTALPAGSNTETMFDTTVECPKNFAAMTCMDTFTYDMKCSHACTVKGYKSDDRGTNWVQFYELSIPGAPVLTAYQDVPISGYPDFKFEVVNGGTTQTTFELSQSLRKV